MSPRKPSKEDRRHQNKGRPSQGLTDVEFKVRLSKPAAAEFREAQKLGALPVAADAWRKAVTLLASWAKSLTATDAK